MYCQLSSPNVFILYIFQMKTDKQLSVPAAFITPSVIDKKKPQIDLLHRASRKRIKAEDGSDS